MTIEQFHSAERLLSSASIYEDQRDAIERIINRTDDIPKPNNLIKIQLGEAYVNTPIAQVRYEEFIKFLEAEKEHFNEQVVDVLHRLGEI